jgi:cephalosporin-C deacetylase-like acetyl esterase
MLRALQGALLLLAMTITPYTYAVSSSAPTFSETCRLAWYQYDTNLPLHPTLKPLDTTSTGIRYTLTYDSIHDQRVTAILALPKQSKAPYPAVIVMHGSGGNKDSSYVKAGAEMLNGIGIAALSIDAQYCGDRKRPERSGDIFLPNSYTARDAWVQTVVDLRRAIDYLQSRPDIAKNRIGYLGFSMGAMLGSVLGGVDRRVAALCLAVPGGGFVQIAEHIAAYPLLRAHWPITINPQVMKIIQSVSQITDPIYYIGRIAPRPMLIFTAKYDEIIPPAASKALIAAARNDKNLRVIEVNSGHILNPEIIFTIRDWFQKHLLPQTTSLNASFKARAYCSGTYSAR